MKTIGYILAILGAVFLALALFVGSVGPETYVYLGHRVPTKYVDEITELGLLKEDEHLRYFYSIGLLSITEGLFFLTDKRFVAYSTDWEEPETFVPFEDIINLHVEYNENFLDDSFIYIETKDGVELDIPVSSEKGRDVLFYEFLVENANLETNKRKIEEDVIQ